MSLSKLNSLYTLVNISVLVDLMYYKVGLSVLKAVKNFNVGT